MVLEERSSEGNNRINQIAIYNARSHLSDCTTCKRIQGQNMGGLLTTVAWIIFLSFLADVTDGNCIHPRYPRTYRTNEIRLELCKNVYMEYPTVCRWDGSWKTYDELCYDHLDNFGLSRRWFLLKWLLQLRQQQQSQYYSKYYYEEKAYKDHVPPYHGYENYDTPVGFNESPVILLSHFFGNGIANNYDSPSDPYDPDSDSTSYDDLPQPTYKQPEGQQHPHTTKYANPSHQPSKQPHPARYQSSQDHDSHSSQYTSFKTTTPAT